MEENSRENELQTFINQLMETRVKALEEGQKDINERLSKFEGKQDTLIEMVAEMKEENKTKSKQRDNNLNSAFMTVVTSIITAIIGYVIAFFTMK